MINEHTRGLLRQIFSQDQVEKIEEAYENLDHNVLEWLNCVDAAYSAGYAEGCWDTTIRYDLSTEDPVLERLARQAMKDYNK